VLRCHAWSSSAPIPPACHRARGPQGQALRVAAKSAAIHDRHSTRWRSQTAVGAEEWLRRGQTKEWARRQVSCQDFVITIREGHHQFSWHKKQEQSRISPSDTVVVLNLSTQRPQERRGCTPPFFALYKDTIDHWVMLTTQRDRQRGASEKSLDSVSAKVQTGAGRNAVARRSAGKPIVRSPALGYCLRATVRCAIAKEVIACSERPLCRLHG
jgi:hypothetical protein